MAGKSGAKAPAGAATNAPEQVIATALRTAAGSQRASADMLDALASMYEGAAPAAAVGGNVAATAGAPAAGGVTPDQVKDALMKLVQADKGQRTRVDPLIVKHCGSLVKVGDIPADKLPALLAEANALIAAPPATSADDL